MPIWYAFRVPPQKEFVAQTILTRRGFTAVVPSEVRFLRRSRSSRKTRERTSPLLHGYVLIPFEGEPQWHHLFNLGIIQSVVGFGGVPAQIRPDAIDAILKLSRIPVPHRSSVNTRRSLAIGDCATLNGRGFQNYPVRVEEIKGEAAKVMLEMFGATREVFVSLSELEAA